MKQNFTDLLAVKFKLHGRTKIEGFDCYGLAIEVLKRTGITLPDLWKNKEIETSKYFNKLEKPENYCIVEMSFVGSINHVAVYIGNGMIIHARKDCGVIIEPMKRYLNNVRGYYKVNS